MILSRHVVHDESAFPAKIHAAPSQCGPIARDNRLVTPLVVTLLMVNTHNGLVVCMVVPLVHQFLHQRGLHHDQWLLPRYRNLKHQHQQLIQMPFLHTLWYLS